MSNNSNGSDSQSKCRYKAALAISKDKQRKAIQEDSDLLLSHGLKLTSVDNGVHAALVSDIKNGTIRTWNLLHFDVKTWNWLRPILLASYHSGISDKKDSD